MHFEGTYFEDSDFSAPQMFAMTRQIHNKIDMDAHTQQSVFNDECTLHIQLTLSQNSINLNFKWLKMGNTSKLKHPVLLTNEE